LFFCVNPTPNEGPNSAGEDSYQTIEHTLRFELLHQNQDETRKRTKPCQVAEDAQHSIFL